MLGSHQFGRNNPNIKRNLALMGVYQKNMQPQATTTAPIYSTTTPPMTTKTAPSSTITTTTAPSSTITRAPQYSQLVNAINCAYKNGCFGQYSNQIYNTLMAILNRLPSDAVFALQNALYSIYRSNYQFLFNNVGALWANVPTNQKNAIIYGINCGYNNGCISQNVYNMLQKLLNILNSYSGPPQTVSSILNSDYNACMANSPNSGVCNYFIEANNAYNSFYMGEYGVQYY
uniref:Uncharacterized protein n=1 Tax=viral metagenome TaxID=1070528 RepID=A0A6C0I1R3_9ZZZZ